MQVDLRLTLDGTDGCGALDVAVELERLFEDQGVRFASGGATFEVMVRAARVIALGDFLDGTGDEDEGRLS